MDEEHLAAAVRYVCLDPMRARLVEQAQDWPWPSTRAHLSGQEPIRQRLPDLAGLLDLDLNEAMFERLRKAETVGRTLGDEAFTERIAKATGQDQRPGRRGPKPKSG